MLFMIESSFHQIVLAQSKREIELLIKIFGIIQLS
jgi:hypothetical protein